MKKWSLVISMVMALLLVFGTTASAFDDLPKGTDRDKIMSLQERGIVSGYGTTFRGEQSLTNAEGIHLIVKAADLSLASFRFFKEPLASDSFDHVANDAWYAPSFVIAAVNGLELTRDILPGAAMTREAYAHHLLTALLLKGEYAFTKIFFQITDGENVNTEYLNSLQLLLNSRIITLPEDGKFRPQEPIARQDAAIWAYNMMEFIKAHGEATLPHDGANIDKDVAMSVAPVNDEVNKVTLSWGEKPHSGYSLSITRIEFKNDQTAEIHYKLHLPEKDKLYLQVITTPTATTYVSSAFKPVHVLDK